MPNAVQQLARRGRRIGTKAAKTGARLARTGAEQVLERALSDESAERIRRRAHRIAAAAGVKADADSPARERRGGTSAAAPEAPARGPAPQATTPAPPTAAEAVEAELAEPAAWRESETEPSPPDPLLEHVSEEATLAGESADRGAEEGAGPEVTIGEPWPGYDQMRARDIVDRLGGADRDVAAAVRLYEMSGKKRKSVLAAAARSGGG